MEIKWWVQHSFFSINVSSVFFKPFPSWLQIPSAGVPSANLENCSFCISFLSLNRDESERRKRKTPKKMLLFSVYFLLHSLLSPVEENILQGSGVGFSFDEKKKRVVGKVNKKNKCNYRRPWEGRGTCRGSRVLPMNPGQETEESLIWSIEGS